MIPPALRVEIYLGSASDKIFGMGRDYVHLRHSASPFGNVRARFSFCQGKTIQPVLTLIFQHVANIYWIGAAQR
jgi:hypothetical protein